MRKVFRRFFIFLMLGVFVFMLSGCSEQAVSRDKPVAVDYWPTNGWRSSTPEAQGMDSEKIYQMFKNIKDKNLGIHTVLVVKNGYMVAEGSFYPYTKDNRHIMNSATKSITSALVGMAIEDGYIKGVDQKVMDIFSDMNIQNMDDKKKNLTVKDFLTMTTGLEWVEQGQYNTPGDYSGQMWSSPNAVQFVLDKEVKNEPGKTFYYSSGSSHVLSGIIQKTTGKTSLEYAEEKLFKPLGITGISWMKDKQGIYAGSGRIFMKPEDMAKFGYLYLRNGKWEDKQIVPENWVKESTAKYIDTPNGLAGRYGYGYQWWMNSFGGYSARGFGGQYIFVIPEHDMVVVFTSGLKNHEFYTPEDLVKNYLIPADKSDGALPENKTAQDALNGILQDISQAPSARAVPDLPDTASRVSGINYSMDNGEIYGFTFDGGNQCHMHWVSDGITYDVKVGLDDVYRVSPMKGFYQGGIDTVVGMKGSFTDDKTFVIDLRTLEDSNSYIMEFTFHDDGTMSAIMATAVNNIKTVDSKGVPDK